MKTISQFKSITERSPATLLQDLLGASALFVILVVGLHLPALV
jgi:hypothetical protein